MPQFKIGISGKMRSGKDTAREFIVKRLREYGIDSEKMSLADPLKDLAKHGLGNTERETLQILGTDIIRKGCGAHFGKENIWASYLVSKANTSPAPVVICADVRFPDELEALQKDGWYLIRINVTEEEQAERPCDDNKKTVGQDHISETALDGMDDHFSVVIPPGKSLAALEQTITSIVDTVVIPRITMKPYTVIKKEVYEHTVSVTASNEIEAIRKVKDGYGSSQGTDFVNDLSEETWRVEGPF